MGKRVLPAAVLHTISDRAMSLGHHINVSASWPLQTAPLTACQLLHTELQTTYLRSPTLLGVQRK